MFRLLISISGIGPKMAATILSGLELGDLKRAIIDGALPILTAVPGIGRKTAERIIVELREKVVLEERRAPAASEKGRASNGLMEDSLRALVELGYRRQNAKEAVEKVLKSSAADKMSLSELIRASLKYI